MIKDNIQNARKKKGITQEELAKKIGVTQQTVQKYENGLISNIPADKIVAICRTLDITPAYLMGWEDTLFNTTPYSQGKSIAIFGTVRAGVGGVAYQEILGYESVDATYNNTNDLFWLKVQGDSMTPELNDGDLVLVRKQTSVDSGDLAVVIVDKEEALVKRVFYDTDLIELHSKNPYYPVRRFVGDEVLDVCVVGLVLESKRKYVKI